MAAECGLTPAQVLLAWGMRDGACVLAKSVSPERIAENLAAASVELPRDALDRITALDRNYRYGLGWLVGHFFTPELWAELKAEEGC